MNILKIQEVKMSVSKILIILIVMQMSLTPSFSQTVTVNPLIDSNALLHNPDMGWVLYDEHPFFNQWSKLGRSEEFNEVDNVALFNMWAYIETQEGVYDFSRMDESYDYWRSKGRSIHLRVSTEHYGWCSDVPGLGCGGIPAYIIERVPDNQKHLRTVPWVTFPVWFVDARNEYYQQRLVAFLEALSAHYSPENGRPVDLVDLRGFGLWGEWHTGYPYPDIAARREALIRIIDIWSDAFPQTKLALSYSHDPDHHPLTYDDYVSYSAFDHAQTRSNITWRRDGCGGVVNENERRFNKEVFQAGDGLLSSEMLGDENALGMSVLDAYTDALSLHPNFIQWHDYLREKHPDVFRHVMLNYGYRLHPEEVIVPYDLVAENEYEIDMRWANHGVGRADRNFNILLRFKDTDNNVLATVDLGETGSKQWVKGGSYGVTKQFTAPINSGDNKLYLGLFDASRGGRMIQLPMHEPDDEWFYFITYLRNEHAGIDFDDETFQGWTDVSSDTQGR